MPGEQRLRQGGRRPQERRAGNLCLEAYRQGGERLRRSRPETKESYNTRFQQKDKDRCSSRLHGRAGVPEREFIP